MITADQAKKLTTDAIDRQIEQKETRAIQWLESYVDEKIAAAANKGLNSITVDTNGVPQNLFRYIIEELKYRGFKGYVTRANYFVINWR